MENQLSKTGLGGAQQVPGHRGKKQRMWDIQKLPRGEFSLNLGVVPKLEKGLLLFPEGLRENGKSSS